MHMHDEATSPELTVYLVYKINKELGLNLIKPPLLKSKRGCLTNSLYTARSTWLYILDFLIPGAFSNLLLCLMLQIL